MTLALAGTAVIASANARVSSYGFLPAKSGENPFLPFSAKHQLVSFANAVPAYFEAYPEREQSFFAAMSACSRLERHLPGLDKQKIIAYYARITRDD